MTSISATNHIGYNYIATYETILATKNVRIWLPLFRLTPRRRGSPGMISVKFLPKAHRWPRYQMV